MAGSGFAPSLSHVEGRCQFGALFACLFNFLFFKNQSKTRYVAECNVLQLSPLHCFKLVLTLSFYISSIDKI